MVWFFLFGKNTPKLATLSIIISCFSLNFLYLFATQRVCVWSHIKFYFQSRMLHSHFKNGDRIQKMVILICMFPCDLKFAKSFHVKINSYYVPLIESILKCSDLWATSSSEFLISFWVMCIVCHDFFINIQ
jgi:hypothetical protein